MVINILSKTEETRNKSNMNETNQLKFGMDRILSKDTNSKRKPEEPTPTTTPCAGCISSLYRNCRLSQHSTSSNNPFHNFYNTSVHTPQPLRPYTNVLIQADVSADSCQASNVATGKRKRSWSRAVFSNLQRKGLEKRFQLQKYITKPDRRQLAATLGLTDAQVKVWFQNRRMKWRHTKESKQSGTSDVNLQGNVSLKPNSQQSDSDCDSDIDVQTVDT